MGETLKIGDLEIQRLDPKVVAVVGGGDFLSDVERAKRDGAEIIEIRVDWWYNDPATAVAALKKFSETADIPSIATVRRIADANDPEKEGFQGTEEERLSLIKVLLDYVSAIDIEYEADEIRDDVIADARKKKVAVILSHVVPKHTPSDNEMKGLMREMQKIPADAFKLTAFAKNTEDMIRHMYVLTDMIDENPDKPNIAISMGVEGVASRVIFPLLGSYLTYGFLKPEFPWQVAVKDLKNTIDFLKVAIPVIEDIRRVKEIPQDILEALQ